MHRQTSRELWSREVVHEQAGRQRRDLGGHVQQALLYWLHVANARGRYSRGSAETLLAEDLNILFRGGTPSDLLEPIRRLFGRLDVAPSDLAGRPSRSPLFPLAFLALKARGAKDWETGLGISLVTRGRQHVVQYHHIFPKAVLREADYSPGEINEIANLAFSAYRPQGTDGVFSRNRQPTREGSAGESAHPAGPAAP